MHTEMNYHRQWISNQILCFPLGECMCSNLSSNDKGRVDAENTSCVAHPPESLLSKSDAVLWARLVFNRRCII